MKKAILVTFLLIPILIFPAVSMGGEHNHNNGGKHHAKGHDHGKKHVGYAHMVLSKAEELNLTDKQLGLITRIHLQHKKARKELRRELHKSMTQIHQGLMDPATEDKIIQDAVKAHTETINKLAENALTERKRVNSVLTEDQKKQIMPMKEEHEHGGIRHFEEEHKESQEENKEAQRPGRAYQEEEPSSQHGTKQGKQQPLFSELDKNEDGYISQEEAQASKALSSNFKLIDKNNDNKIDRSEFGTFESLQLRGFDHGGPPSGYEYGEGRKPQD